MVDRATATNARRSV